MVMINDDTSTDRCSETMVMLVIRIYNDQGDKNDNDHDDNDDNDKEHHHHLSMKIYPIKASLHAIWPCN